MRPALALVLLLVLALGRHPAQGDGIIPPPTRSPRETLTPTPGYWLYFPEAIRNPVVTVVCAKACDEPPALMTAMPWPTVLPPAFSITRTPTP